MSTATAIRPDIEHHTLVAIRTHVPLQFGGVTDSPSVKQGFTLAPARLLPSLDWRECTKDEPPTGIGLTKMAKTPSGGRVVLRCYVPMSSVAEFVYGE